MARCVHDVTGMRPVALSVPLLLLAPRAVNACTPPSSCSPGFVYPANGATLPGTPPALVLRPSSSSMSGNPHLTRNGVEVPFTLVPDTANDDILVVPATPFSAGTYTLSRTEGCPLTNLDVDTSTFTIGVYRGWCDSR